MHFYADLEALIPDRAHPPPPPTFSVYVAKYTTLLTAPQSMNEKYLQKGIRYNLQTFRHLLLSA